MNKKEKKQNGIIIDKDVIGTEMLVMAGELEQISCDIDGIENLLCALKYGLFNKENYVNEEMAHSIFDSLCKSLHNINEDVTVLQEQALEVREKVGEAS